MNEQGSICDRSIRILKVGLALATIVMFAASFLDSVHAWSVASWKLLTWPVRTLLVALTLGCLLPGTAGIPGRQFEKFFEGLKPGSLNVAFGMTALVLMVTFMVLASSNHVMGDGYTVLGNIEAGKQTSTTEPMSYFLHYWLYRLSESGSSLFVYQLTAWVAAIAFLIFLYTWPSSRKTGFIIMLAALSFGAMQFFAGYAENYTLAFLLAVFYVASASRDIVNRRFRVLTVLFFLAAVSFHLTASCLLPSLAYYLWSVLNPGRFRQVTLALIICFAAGCAGYLYNTGLLEHAFVPLYPTANNPYHLLSVAHLTDMVNIVLRVYPLLPAIVLLPALRVVADRTFLIVGLAGALLLTVLIDPKIGAIRDWDLLSVASAPALIMIARSIEECAQLSIRRVGAMVLPLILFGILHTGSWLWFNSHTRQAYPLIRDTISSDVHYSPNYYEGSRLISWHVLASNTCFDTLESIRALEIYTRRHPDDDLSNFQLAYYIALTGRPEVAGRMLAGRYRGLVRDRTIVASIGKIFSETKRQDDEKGLLEAAVEYHPDCDWILVPLLRAYRDRHEYKKVYDLFKRSRINRRDMPPPAITGQIEACVRLGKFAEAQSELELIFSHIPPGPKEAADSLLQALKAGDSTRIYKFAASLSSH